MSRGLGVKEYNTEEIHRKKKKTVENKQEAPYHRQEQSPSDSQKEKRGRGASLSIMKNLMAACQLVNEG